MNNLTFWTTNPHKLKEARAILWVELKWYTNLDLIKIDKAYGWDIPEIQSMDVLEIVRRKAKDVWGILGRPVIVEDTWLFINSLKWFPGPFVKYIVDDSWPWLDVIFKMMRWVSDRTAKAITGVCMYTWDKYITGYWELDWYIPETPRWNKFWWSNAFEQIWNSKTFWEMTEYEKNQISMRKLALEDFERNLR